MCPHGCLGCSSQSLRYLFLRSFSPSGRNNITDLWCFVLSLFCVFLLGCKQETKLTTTTDPSAATSPTHRYSDAGNRHSDADIELAISESRNQDAKNMLRQNLLQSRDDVVGIFKLAELEAIDENWSLAIDLLSEISPDHPQAGIAALGQAADWAVAAQDYRLAELKYREILARVPDADLARRQLAFLYNCQGRRFEAAQLIQQLCRAGDILEDELRSLLFVADGMFADDARATAELESQSESRRYDPIGNCGKARKAFSSHHLEDAASLIHSELTGKTTAPSIWAFYGRIISELQDDEQLTWWLQQIDADPELKDKLKQEPEFHVAVGTLAIHQSDFETAIVSLAQAIKTEPSDVRAIGRLRQALLALGDVEQAERLAQRFNQLNDLTRKSQQIAGMDQPDPDIIHQIADQLEGMGRRLEATIWLAIEQMHRSPDSSSIQSLNRRRVELVESQTDFQTEAERLCSIDISRYQSSEDKLRSLLSTISQTAAGPSTRSSLPRERADLSSVQLRFTDIASEWNCNHAFKTRESPKLSGFTIYEQMGGGVAAIDFDLDGRVDLYFAQGAADPPTLVSNQSNTLYRQLELELIDVTVQANVVELRYTCGVTAGDWNQDGFEDLYAANLGTDSLWINQGDGTFFRTVWDAEESTNGFDTSAAIADISGDHLPDLVQLRYLRDDKAFESPVVDEAGYVAESFGPSRYLPSLDRYYLNQPNGRPVLCQFTSDESAAATGLGLVIANLGNDNSNDVFVANDQMPNQLWSIVPSQGLREDEPTTAINSLIESRIPNWNNVAITSGVAFDAAGNSTACMGIAAADFDSTGSLDLFVTNFAREPNNLFINDFGRYRDRAFAFGLGHPSLPLVGFGAQPIDINNDGLIDIAVTNGHVDNIRGEPAPPNQPFQFFANAGDSFQLVDAGLPGSYSLSSHVGRAMATIDFNRDGRLDLVITHLGQPTALLLNETKTDNHYLQLSLVGRSCERLPIGACVRLSDRNSRKVRTECLVAGNGYLGRNEPILHFGLGNQSFLPTIQIAWPDGSTQELRDVAVDRRLLIVQGLPEVVEL